MPNTHPEEPSYPPPTASVAPRTSSPEPIVEGEKPAPTRRLTRRVTSRQSSQEPQLAVVEENTAEAPKPRRVSVPSLLLRAGVVSNTTLFAPGSDTSRPCWDRNASAYRD